MNSVTQRSPLPMIRRIANRFLLGWLARWFCMLRRPRVRSPDCGYLQHRVLEIDAVLRFKIVGIGRRPMLIECRTDLLISHSRILLLLLLAVHLEPPNVTEAKCSSGIRVYDSSSRPVSSITPASYASERSHQPLGNPNINHD